MEYYSIFKNKEILAFATTRMEMEDTVLSEISQARKVKTTCSHIYMESNKAALIKGQNRMMVNRDQQQERGQEKYWSKDTKL
jgi:hypothetical protein